MSIIIKRNITKRILCASFITRSQSTKSDCIKSMHLDIEIPKCNVVEYIMKDFGKWHNKIALECAVTQKVYTFAETRKHSINLGKSLRKAFQVQPGDVVAVYLPNNPDYAVCVLGGILSGATVTTINPAYTLDELERQLKDSKAKVIITCNTYWHTTQKAIERLQRLIPVVVIKLKNDESIPEKAINYDDLLEMNVDLPDLVPINEKHTVLLPYSSGTTGLPKGVMLANSNLVANLAQQLSFEVQYATETTDYDQEVLPLILPMYHIYGFTMSTISLLQIGCKLVTVPKFTPDTFLNMLTRYKPTIMHLVPPLVAFFMTHPQVRPQHFERLKATLCGAAPLGASDEERFREVVKKPFQILQAYGMTEASPLVTIVPQAYEAKCTGSVGHPVANTSVKVVNPDDATFTHVEPHQSGELLIKGPQIMKGYFNKPEDTKDAFADGWYRTGDIGKYDENNMLYIVDRIKELIKVKGFQVAPAELEEIIRSYPGISEAAVIGIPHEYLGESPRAYIVLKPGEKVNTSKLSEYINGKVAKHKRIVGGVAVLDTIPKNPSGKILRRELKKLYIERGI